MYTQDDFSHDISTCLTSNENASEMLTHMGRIVRQAQEFLTADEIQSTLNTIEGSSVDTVALVERVKENLRIRQQWDKNANMARERGMLALFGETDDEPFPPPPFFTDEEPTLQQCPYCQAYHEPHLIEQCPRKPKT